MIESDLNYYSQKAKEYSYQSRIDIIETVYRVKGGHLGGSLSVIDILSAIYSFYNHYPFELILSKGHCVLAWVITLLRVGEIDKKDLISFYGDNSKFGGHPKRGTSKSITWSTGSLGHGLSVACGKALARPEKKFFCVLGDGELNEGSVWEALMFLAQHKLKNVIVLIDNNKQESLAMTEDILSIESLDRKIGGMKLNAQRVDGHNIDLLVNNIKSFFEDNNLSDLPQVFICDTIKGKGVSFMEKVPMWHHRKIKDFEFEKALKELI